MFIQLTRWNSYRGANSVHGQVVFVKPNKITYLWPTMQQANFPGPQDSPAMTRVREPVTWIDFGGDEDTGLQVQETPEEIMKLIQEESR